MRKLFVLLLIPFFSCNEHPSHFVKGTLIIEAIGSDGIILAADSRAGWIRHMYSPVEKYRDSVPKIFLIKNSGLVAFYGVENYDGKGPEEVIKQFEAIPFNDSSYRLFKYFVNYLADKYPITESNGFKHNIYISGLYRNGEPAIIVGNLSKPTNEISNVRMRNDSFYTTSPDCTKYFSNLYKDNMSTEQLIPIIKKAFQYMSKIDTTYTIGGPITIVKVSRDNSIHWIQNDFRGYESQWKQINR